ncbi:PepSY domain-containing protein [Puniceibacterium sp. IMCC21224]|uniref:PepSY domain-containing protein n=1 Tax=Puniceibacterium sp. IMCC21224 TaxID=1618204 RepID=UPI00064DE602|nr:PepSY domain-containing protein [Puniceibacterium sp. IMCC21224]KMK65542.1 Peptidase propeptide and YPEB domain [Puniceibacterium sp. IMCC21224]
MFRKSLTALVLIAPVAVFAADDAVSAEVQEQIVSMLADMQCEMDVDDIEADDGGYELDDVYCADGQYDINLDGDLKVTNKRKE